MMNNQIVDEKYIKDQGGVIFEPPDGKLSMPNLDYILDTIIEILEYKNTPEMTKLFKTNKTEYDACMEDKFEQFADTHYSIFSMVISGNDITPMITMFEKLNEAKSGKTTLENVDKKITESLRQKYVEPMMKNLKK